MKIARENVGQKLHFLVLIDGLAPDFTAQVPEAVDLVVDGLGDFPLTVDPGNSSAVFLITQAGQFQTPGQYQGSVRVRYDAGHVYYSSLFDLVVGSVFD